jgi:hypothetical protein
MVKNDNLKQEQEDTIMIKFTGRRSLIIFIMLAFIVTFFTTPAISDEKKQAPAISGEKKQPPKKFPVSGKRYNVETARQMTKIDDVDGHYVAISESKGVDIKSGVQTFSTTISDTVKGNGTFFVYFKGVMVDGGTYYGKSEGKITTVLSPSGKPVTSMEGTWAVTDFQMAGKNYVGDGTFRSKVIGPGISSMQHKGEIRLKE